MSGDSDVALDGQALTQARKDRHAKWKAEHTAAIVASGIPHQATNNGESLLFREHGKPKADFFPSTGRWRVAGEHRTWRGGAVAFLGWYGRQGVAP